MLLLLEYQRTQNRSEFIERQGTNFFRALLGLYSKIAKLETIQYLLTMFDDTTQSGAYVSMLLAAAESLNVAVAEVFFSSFEKHRDPYVLHQAARMLARLLAAGSVLPPRSLRVFAQWLGTTIQGGEPGSCELALHALQRILTRTSLRQDIFSAVDQALVAPLSLENRVQAQYQAVFCLWVLSFDPSIVSQLRDSPAVLRVAGLLRTVRKEKLARVALAFLRNLLEKAEDAESKRKFATTMIAQKALQSADGFLKQKVFSDEEVVADCEYLVPQLTSYLESMSSFEEYRVEVMSGQLEWSPVHRSERFWRENINNINDKHGELVKVLARLLETSPTYDILAVAVHDLGQYVRFYPRGKSLLETLGAKAAIVGLMDHPNPAVRYEALVATQKILTQNWEYLGQKLVKEAKDAKSGGAAAQ